MRSENFSNLSNPQSDLLQGQKDDAAANVAIWLSDGGTLQQNNVAVCNNGVQWTKDNGQFLSGNGTIDFDNAMSVAGGSLSDVFKPMFMIGILAFECFFGTKFPTYVDDDHAVGGFQIIPNKALAEFNRNNNQTQFTYQDVQTKGSAADVPVPFTQFNNASKVASWYLAHNLQLCTFDSGQVGAITNSAEAIFFAIASYKEGPGAIHGARQACADAGRDNTVWDNVKAYFPDAIQDRVKVYVAMVDLYAGALYI